MEQTPDATPEQDAPAAPQTDETTPQTAEPATDDKETATSEETTETTENDAGEQADADEADEAEQTEDGEEPDDENSEAAKWRIKAKEAEALADRMERKLHDYRIEQLGRDIAGYGWHETAPDLAADLAEMDIQAYFTEDEELTEEGKRIVQELKSAYHPDIIWHRSHPIPHMPMHDRSYDFGGSPKERFRNTIMSAGGRQ
ncbi:hypothetical protein [Bifidobacterium simiiventris]|uniref:hypothetical protein n=1 Tax=Bifidobacterium simiiventris TaxID=2834434 RepID=UPI001C56E2B7|nr:hypothetical protein [Bifidobacterium simiiventris]MBW3079442.1 hypothetical protein [Bifidobacterium simiiventris]